MDAGGSTDPIDPLDFTGRCVLVTGGTKGIGLVGNADIVVASDDATFGLPEVDRGALGAATHLARLVPQHRMRAMVYTAQPATSRALTGGWSMTTSAMPGRCWMVTMGMSCSGVCGGTDRPRPGPGPGGTCAAPHSACG